MGSKVYLTSSTGARYRPVGTAAQYYIKELTTRELDLTAKLVALVKRELDLNAILKTPSVRATYELDLVAELNAHVKSGYNLYAKNLATGVETFLGFVPDSAPLELAGVALANGHYEIRVDLQGYFWRNQRTIKRFIVEISGGNVVVALPTANNLAYRYLTTTTLLTWNWLPTTAVETPDNFSIWTGPADPVDTSGAAAYTVPSPAPGAYSVAIAQGAAILYVAVAAVKGVHKGSIAKLTIPAPPVTLNSPEQFAQFPSFP